MEINIPMVKLIVCGMLWLLSVKMTHTKLMYIYYGLRLRFKRFCIKKIR